MRTIRAFAIVPALAVVLSASQHNTGHAQTPGSRTIIFATSGTWSVPPNANASAITVEAWGGGGGGSFVGGGQGGSYFMAKFAITANQQIRLTIGTAGTGAPIGGDKGGNGGTTTVDSGSGLTFQAGGGAGAGTGGMGTYSGPPVPLSGSTFYFRGAVGQFGSSSKLLSTSIIDATHTVATSTGGDGGEAGNSPNTKGFGGAEACVLTPPSSVFQPYQCNPYPAWGTVIGAGVLGTGPTPGVTPGGGGGGAPLLSGLSKKITAANGAPGLVVITY